jgi:hypothetical protein
MYVQLWNSAIGQESSLCPRSGDELEGEGGAGSWKEEEQKEGGEVGKREVYRDGEGRGQEG